MKNDKLNTTLYIIVCFVLVAGTAKIMAFARDNFEENQRVMAEALPPIEQEIKQNQIRYLLEEGYLPAPQVLAELK